MFFYSPATTTQKENTMGQVKRIAYVKSVDEAIAKMKSGIDFVICNDRKDIQIGCSMCTEHLYVRDENDAKRIKDETEWTTNVPWKFPKSTRFCVWSLLEATLTLNRLFFVVHECEMPLGYGD